VIGLQWYAIGIFLPGLVTLVLFPHQVQAADQAAEGMSRSHALLNQGFVLMAASSVVLLIITALVSPLLATLYGEEFIGLAWVVWGFIVAALAAGPMNMVGNAMFASGRHWHWAAITAMWLPLLILLSFQAVEGGVKWVPLAFAAANIAALCLGRAAISRWKEPHTG
jgi:O-antigen/teichoic acid export membrane protein